MSEEPTFAEAFSAAVARRGRTLSWIQQRLADSGFKVSVATLSYWQSGRSEPGRRTSLGAIEVLEDVLEVPRDSLRHRLAGPKPRGRAVHARARLSDRATAIVPTGELAMRVMEEFGGGPVSAVSRLSVHDRVDVGADRTERRQEVRELLRADADGISSIQVVYVQDSQKPAAAEIEGVSNCRLGRSYSSPEHRLTVVELLLVKELDRGESLMTEHRILPSEHDTESHRLERVSAIPIRQVVLEVRFDPACLPVRVERYLKTTFDGPAEEVRQIDLSGAGAQAVFLDAFPGVAGICWHWE